MFSFQWRAVPTVQDCNKRETNEAAQSYSSPWLSVLSCIFIKHTSEFWVVKWVIFNAFVFRCRPESSTVLLWGFAVPQQIRPLLNLGLLPVCLGDDKWHMLSFQWSSGDLAQPLAQLLALRQATRSLLSFLVFKIGRRCHFWIPPLDLTACEFPTLVVGISSTP